MYKLDFNDIADRPRQADRLIVRFRSADFRRCKSAYPSISLLLPDYATSNVFSPISFTLSVERSPSEQQDGTLSAKGSKFFPSSNFARVRYISSNQLDYNQIAKTGHFVNLLKQTKVSREVGHVVAVYCKHKFTDIKSDEYANWADMDTIEN